MCARGSGTGAKHTELNRVCVSLDHGGCQTQLQPKEKISCHPMLCFALLRAVVKPLGHIQGGKILGVILISNTHLEGFVCIFLDLEGICV